MILRNMNARNKIKHQAVFTTLHDLRSIDKVKNLVNRFNKEKAVPIIVGKYGYLINGTHRYYAYLIRKSKGLEDNFPIVHLNELNCWVGDGIREYLESREEFRFFELDSFWRDNWEFSDWYKANEETLTGSAVTA